MVDKGLVAGLLLVAAAGLYLLSWKLWRYCCSRRLGEPQTNEASEPLIAEDLLLGQTLKRPPLSRYRDGSCAGPPSFKFLPNSEGGKGELIGHNSQANINAAQNSILVLEVISGPSAGLRTSQQSLHSSSLSLTVGRVAQNDLVLSDPEVSGMHAFITWNPQNSTWELVDVGSLNGTLVNCQPVSAIQSSHTTTRQHGNPVGLANGDIITLGSTSQVLVQISSDSNGFHFPITSTPFGVGTASDAMTIRRGGKQFPMEDVCLCEWPLRGLQEFGVFCIFDGHGGAAAAEAASKIMPQKLSDILGVHTRRAGVLSNYDASDILKDAFNATEESLVHEYEGCTATVLLLWCDASKDFYAQCANVGDSTCVFSVEGKHIQMTEDHRLTSLSEKCRLLEMGKQLKEGETRLCGMNIARVLGDKFLKEQDVRFSPQPFVSEVLRITRESKALCVMASDGLWDVLSPRRALQLALEAREGSSVDGGMKVLPQTANRIAELLVNKARALRTKDNTSVIVMDFLSCL